jgi:23S rRNA pseudouridine2457 synthase
VTAVTGTGCSTLKIDVDDGIAVEIKPADDPVRTAADGTIFRKCDGNPGFPFDTGFVPFAAHGATVFEFTATVHHSITLVKDSNVKKYFIINKPYDVLCQFRRTAERKTLADFGPFPHDVYPAGRLDTDSEGLVLLTNDGLLQHRLIEPRYRHPRTYIVQVERIPGDAALAQLRSGIMLDGTMTLPAEARLIPEPDWLWERSVPIRFRKNVPTAWMEIAITEGRNRQVRRMTAATGHPTLRLVRRSIGPFEIGSLQPGESRPLTTVEVALLRNTLA